MIDASMPGACPPAESGPVEGTFYRLAEPHLSIGSTTAKGSWRKPHKVKGPHFQRVDLCAAHAFSIFKSLEAIQEARKISPWAAKKSLASVDISSDMGNVVETPSDVADTHYDWWSSPYLDS